MTWRLAGSLEQLRAQVDERWPGRSRVSDGTIGDLDHASRTSDHNPWVPPPKGGVVTAIDLTDDPARGPDMAHLSEALRLSKDPRIKYDIFQGRIFSSYSTSTRKAWTWGPYSGVNSHAHHMHLSVQPQGYDDRSPWQIEEDWFALATKEDLREVVREELNKQRKLLAVGKTQKGYDPDKVNIKVAIEKGGKP